MGTLPGPWFRPRQVIPEAAHPTGVSHLRFTAHMATDQRRVESGQARRPTTADLLAIRQDRSEYARHGNPACQRSTFHNNLCADSTNAGAAIGPKPRRPYHGLCDPAGPNRYRAELLTSTLRP